MKVEWEYLLAMGIVSALAFYGYQQREISDISTLFAIGGSILTLMVVIAFPVEFGKLNVGNFSLQTAISLIVLGFPAIVRGGAPVSFVAPAPYVVLVAIATEEIIRIAAFFITYVAFEMPRFAVGVSGVTFAAMHLYWYPTEWVSAIMAGALFSIMLLYFQSQLSCIASHGTYDLFAFGYLSLPIYLLIFLISLILGVTPKLKKVEI